MLAVLFCIIFAVTSSETARSANSDELISTNDRNYSENYSKRLEEISDVLKNGMYSENCTKNEILPFNIVPEISRIEKGKNSFPTNSSSRQPRSSW
jgi:hypothetical protein